MNEKNPIIHSYLNNKTVPKKKIFKISYKKLLVSNTAKFFLLDF